MDFYKIYADIFPFWDGLSEEDKQLLSSNSSIVEFDKAQSVHNNNECSGLYIVKSGKLRIYMLSEEGKEITLYRLSKGEVCMLSASCVLQSITFDVYIEAEMQSECCMIPSHVFGALSERIPEVKIYALETAVTRFSDVMWVMQQIVFMSIDKRLAIFLLEESQYGDSDSIIMTHEQIARHLGTAREVITRLLKHLSSDGAISVTRKGITITDKNKLRRIAY